MCRIVVTGKIKGKARPRVYNKRAITPKDTLNYENWILFNYRDQGGKLNEGAVELEIHCYFAIPESYSKKRRLKILEGEEVPTKKPDIDNICKIVLDAINKVAYYDDSQVVSIIAKKFYTQDEERLEFEVRELF